MSPEPAFHYEIEKSRDEALGMNVTTFRCHGRLTSNNSNEVKEVIKPLLGNGERIVLDLADLNYLDSSGLGTLVGLKVSAINKGLGRLELENLTPRVKELLSLANLTSLFAK